MKKSDLAYVRKRKRRKVAAIVTAISTMAVAVFVLVAFLGRFVGTFTVSLDTGELKLSLCEKSSFNNPTSYLKLKSIPDFALTTYTDLPSSSELDNEETTYLDGEIKDAKGKSSLKYFKYTFFVKNGGEIPASYDMKVNITRNTPSDDRRYLDSLLRVIVYHNNINSDTHDHEVYAKENTDPSPTYGYEEGEYTYKAAISFQNPEDAERYGGYEFPGFANRFESSTVAARIPQVSLQQDETIRYTIVVWLEGNDPDATGAAPVNANLKLGVTINAYENQ